MASNFLRCFAAIPVSLLQRARLHTVVCQLRLYCLQLPTPPNTTPYSFAREGNGCTFLPQGLHSKRRQRDYFRTNRNNLNRPQRVPIRGMYVCMYLFHVIYFAYPTGCKMLIKRGGGSTPNVGRAASVCQKQNVQRRNRDSDSINNRWLHTRHNVSMNVYR